MDYVFEAKGHVKHSLHISGRCIATIVPAKGAVVWVVDWVLRSVRAAGIQRSAPRVTDSEPSIESLPQTVTSR
eukprot:78539-Amphidinium_carterae.2